jgi:hypothetical protein
MAIPGVRVVRRSGGFDVEQRQTATISSPTRSGVRLILAGKGVPDVEILRMLEQLRTADEAIWGQDW